MEKFKLNLEYKVGKAVFSTNLFETEHFKITYKATKSHISLKMAAFVPLEIQAFHTTSKLTAEFLSMGISLGLNVVKCLKMRDSHTHSDL